jgi:hypothetical protein
MMLPRAVFVGYWLSVVLSLSVVSPATPARPSSVGAWGTSEVADLRRASLGTTPPTGQGTTDNGRAGVAGDATDNHRPEYLWFEAENMRGFSITRANEPASNASWIEPPAAKVPGWGMNGPGVSAEWTQGGESEWNSAAASADESRASIYQEFDVPRAGEYRVWVRYADWADKTEAFSIHLVQNRRVVFQRELGAKDVVDPHDETSMYWGWAFAWDGVSAKLEKGPARLTIEVVKAAQARRHVDCVLVTDDPAYVPVGRRKPDFAAARYMREWSAARAAAPALAPLLDASAPARLPDAWRRRPVAGRDFQMPWNISEEFWKQYDKPPAERSLVPYSTERQKEFLALYKGKTDVPIFSSKLVTPVFHINRLGDHLAEGSAFVRHLRETNSPFGIVINYGEAKLPDEKAHAAWALLSGELRERFVGWISGENIGYVLDGPVPRPVLTPEMTRAQMLESKRDFLTRGLEAKWGATFKSQTGPMWDKLIPALSASHTTYAHALGRWGCPLIGMEMQGVIPMTGMRVAFARGAARQYGKNFLYYHAPSFGDASLTFTNQQNFAGPDYFYHTRYGPSMGPSLAWYRKNYYLFYMAGASAIYLEQGFDQFFKPGPGEHAFQLNPLGRITAEFMRFAERHPDRGTPYTPIAFLLDPAHGWDMISMPHWSFGVSPIDRHDHALRELFGAAYYPALSVEGEEATSDRQTFVNGAFGDVFDVLVASDEGAEAADAYKALVVGGRIAWTPAWTARLSDYVRKGGTVVLNVAQAKGLPPDLLGATLTGATAEAASAICAMPGEGNAVLESQTFRYERLQPRGATVLMATPSGDALVTSNAVGKGRLILSAVPDNLGVDDRLVPAAAHLLAHLCSDATPVRVRGDVEWMVNKTERGWVVTLLNNRGVTKLQQGLATVDRAETVEAKLGLSGGGVASAREWTSDADLPIASGTVTVRIYPGDVKVVELVGRP